MASKTTPARTRRIGRSWFAIAALVLVALLYYRPLHDYVSSRSERATRLSQVVNLQHEQEVLKRRLREAKSATSLAAQERRLGYIHPGEHLFIVKNIPQWRRWHNAARRGH